MNKRLVSEKMFVRIVNYFSISFKILPKYSCGGLPCLFMFIIVENLLKKDVLMWMNFTIEVLLYDTVIKRFKKALMIERIGFNNMYASICNS